MEKLKSGFLSSEIWVSVVMVVLQQIAAFGLLHGADIQPLAEAIVAMLTAGVAFITSMRVVIEIIRARTKLKEKQIETNQQLTTVNNPV